MRREWIEIHSGINRLTRKARLPPCGGSGLKWFDTVSFADKFKSPSMRREWIEMIQYQAGAMGLNVSLHAEGVD